MNLEPLRDALLGDARAKVAAELATADERAAAQRAAAEREGAELAERARAEGAAAAELEAAAEHASTRRGARTLVLAARNDVYEEVRRRAVEGAEALRGKPDYSALLERLAAAAREQLGPEAEVEVDPAAGGVVATVRGRRVDYTLHALTDRCLDLLGARLEQLWA